MSDTDLQLLARYAESGAEDAFAELVRRHLDLVYSAALRQVRSPQLAEEVAQAVFVDLSRNARQLRPDTIVTAWLYAVTRRTAIDVVRRESRRQLREQIATEMNAMNATAGDWTQIEPLLDEAVSALDDTDRAAVLLRYFENKSLREVGAALGTSDDAAQKRVSRAVERLREFFAKRGVTIGASGLVVVISANAIQAAPVGLAVTISTTAALSGTILATAPTVTAAKTIAMTTLQKTLIVAALAVTVGTGIYEARQAAQLREQNQTLQLQQASLAEQIQQSQGERDEAANQLEQLRNGYTGELLKLRAEATHLRNDLRELRLNSSAFEPTNDIEEATVRRWTDRVKALKKYVKETPGCQIPEFQFLDETDWFMAIEVSDNPWRADVDIKRGMIPNLTERAKEHFAGVMINALRKYLEANGGQLPNQLAELKPFCPVSVGDDVLDRYELLHSGNVKDLTEHDRRFSLVSEKKAAADSSTQMMMRMGDTSFATLASY